MDALLFIEDKERDEITLMPLTNVSITSEPISYAKFDPAELTFVTVTSEQRKDEISPEELENKLLNLYLKLVSAK